MAANPDTAIDLRAVTPAASARSSQLEEEVVALFEQLRNPLLRYLLSFRISVPDAEEIVQDVFLALFQHLRRGRSRKNLRGWLFRVAHNLALKNRLKAQRQQPGEPEAQMATGPGPEEQAADQQRQQRLRAVMNALPELDQYCLSLRAEGLPYREIAAILDISLGAVANSLARSLERLSRADGCRRSHAAF
jgi:RNA polymerase sigma-70 factor (ECF subfamily)